MGIHGCDQTCVNTPGSYRCTCSTGFQLNDDQMTCTDPCELLLLHDWHSVSIFSLFIKMCLRYRMSLDKSPRFSFICYFSHLI